MKKKMLCAALLGGLAFAGTALAQEFDDRWYMTGGIQVVKTDSDRDIENKVGLQLGVGRFITPNVSLDFEINHLNPEKAGSDLNWSLYGAGLWGRYHFRQEGQQWWPFLTVGLGAMRHEEELSDILGGRPIDREGSNLFAQIGGGFQSEINDRWAFRGEIGFRGDFDDASLEDDWFGDGIVSLNLIAKLGDAPAPVVVETTPPPPPPPPAVKPCSELDDDNDGVNNCVDKCPNSQAGQAVGADGCPVPLTIDLRGVNFDFDKATLRPDAVQILQEAIGILKKYPELKVEVAGHTDAVGTDAYNQKLSERRAKTVHEFLTGNGIDAGRLVGPTGYGEARPIAPNANADGTDNPEGRAKNRRTELNVQNQ